MSAYIDAYRGRFGVEPICSVLGVSASAYYHRRSGARSQRVVDDERLLALVRELHLANYEAYGSRKTWKALRRAGHDIGRDRVARLMRGAGIRGAKGRTKRWQTTQPELARRLPDLVKRRFEASGRMSSGSRTSPTCAAGRASSSAGFSEGMVCVPPDKPAAV